MSLSMQITATEHGVVRLFAVEMVQPLEHEALCDALGVEDLDATHVDIIAIGDLDELGLEGYLALGMGIEPDEIEAMRPQISALKGDVVLIRSAAFAGMATTLTPKLPLRWIATFGEVPLDTASRNIETVSATGILSGNTPQTKPSNTRVLLWVLIAFALMTALTISMFIRIAQ